MKTRRNLRRSNPRFLSKDDLEVKSWPFSFSCESHYQPKENHLPILTHARRMGKWLRRGEVGEEMMVEVERR